MNGPTLKMIKERGMTVTTLALTKVQVFGDDWLLMSGKLDCGEVVVEVPMKALLTLDTKKDHLENRGGTPANNQAQKAAPSPQQPMNHRPDTTFYNFYSELLKNGHNYFHGSPEEKKKADMWYIAALWEIVKFVRPREVCFEGKDESGKNKTRRMINIGSPTYFMEELEQELAIMRGHPFNFFASLNLIKHVGSGQPELEYKRPYGFEYVWETDQDKYEDLKAKTDPLVEYLTKKGVKFRVIYSGSRSHHVNIPFPELIKHFGVPDQAFYPLEKVGEHRVRIDAQLVKEVGIEPGHTKDTMRVFGVPYTPHPKTSRLRFPLTKENYDSFRPEDCTVEALRAKKIPNHPNYGTPYFNLEVNGGKR
jgi:hypothetical protein